MGVDLKRGYYILNTDGGMASNGRRRSGEPMGIAAIGALLRTPRLAALDEISTAIGPATHNMAEYRGLIEGLTLARNHGIERIRVYMDSELVVDQMSGVSAVRKKHLKELHERARELKAQFASIRISWVPREMNVEADRLVRKELSRVQEPGGR
jgi:ribonuclease HI